MTFRLPLLAAAFAVFSLAHAEEVSLFNGKDLSAWQEPLGSWSVVSSVALDPANAKGFITSAGEGVMLNTAAGKGIDIMSKEVFGDCQIHVEFCVPKDSNSGVYVQGRYEVQILDSYGKPEVAEHDCGAIYQRWKDGKGYEGHAPKLNASKAPGEWQSFDITYRAPRFDATGKKTENGRFIKVVHNGQIVQENVEVTGPTRGSRFEDEAATGPIRLQGDHGPVAFRNLRVMK